MITSKTVSTATTLLSGIFVLMLIVGADFRAKASWLAVA